jgi:hypothetical protein
MAARWLERLGVQVAHGNLFASLRADGVPLFVPLVWNTAGISYWVWCNQSSRQEAVLS